MRGVVPLDHLDAGAAVFRDLVDVRAFHEAQADKARLGSIARRRPMSCGKTWGTGMPNPSPQFLMQIALPDDAN